jgi:hypothetical protein
MEFFAEEKAFAEIVMDAWVEYPTYGYRKMSFYLQRKKHPEATEKRVRRIYKMSGSAGTSPGIQDDQEQQEKGEKVPLPAQEPKDQLCE